MNDFLSDLDSSDFPRQSSRRQTCPECGMTGGYHHTNCPETPEDAENESEEN